MKYLGFGSADFHSSVVTRSCQVS